MTLAQVGIVVGAEIAGLMALCGFFSALVFLAELPSGQGIYQESLSKAMNTYKPLSKKLIIGILGCYLGLGSVGIIGLVILVNMTNTW